MIASIISEAARVSTFESVRILKSRRWIPILFLVAIGSYQATSELIKYSSAISKAPNIWDSYFAFYGSWSACYLTLVVPILFVLLVGDIVMKDVTSDFSKMLTIRLSHKSDSLWIGKCAAIFISALFFSAAIMMTTLVIGGMRGLALSTHLSPLATYSGVPNITSMMHHGVSEIVIRPFTEQTSPLIHLGINLLGVSIAYTLLAIAGVVLGLFGTTLLMPLGTVITTQALIWNYGLFFPNIKLTYLTLYFWRMVTDTQFRPSPFDDSVATISTLFSRDTVMLFNLIMIVILGVIGLIIMRKKSS